MARFLQLLFEIANHPEITPELQEFVEVGTLIVIETDPDLKKWVESGKLKRIK